MGDRGGGSDLVGWLFLRLLGLVSLLAFASLLPQLRGLIGVRGISPAAELLASAREVAGPSAWQRIPTLFWAGSSDAALLAVCWAGAAFSLLLLAGVLPALGAAGAWACYLSITSVGQEFLQYQWDALLLEALVLGLLLAPPALLDRPSAPRPKAAIWLVRWLVFRLMLGSGLVKLESGDPLWRHLLALTVHYETQPLPTPLGYLAHQAPVLFQRFSALAMFAVELGGPLLLLAGRRGRRIAFLGIVSLQLLIAATGNYGMFNLLTIALCVPLLSDADVPARVRVAVGRLEKGTALRPGATPPRAWPRPAVRAATAILLVLTTVEFSRVVPLRPAWPRPLEELDRLAAPFRVANVYGLFAVMTNPRWEIVLEGSDDGVSWKEIPFRWKPQDVTKAPPVVAPHMPRLDWQMWFAALEPDADDVPWFQAFEVRLLSGEPAVWGLLAPGPFGPAHPPRLLRAVRYETRFTDLSTLLRTGCWWRRTASAPFAPEATLSAAP